MSSHFKNYVLGIDVGSVSVKAALLDGAGNVIKATYDRHHGRPVETVSAALGRLFFDTAMKKELCVAVTGSGGKLLGQIFGVEFVNEVIAQARATEKFHPEIRTVIEIGGEDSKLITLKPSRSRKGKLDVEDFSMNASCAAGTGSFLDQQASRLGVSIEGEFSRLALKSKKPPRIAGRCSVFAKSDMIHLQQIGTPDYDIIAGLCYAFVRTFKSDIAKGKKLDKPVSFHGGVAANDAIIKAFRDVFKLSEAELIRPEYFAEMGAIGAALVAIEKKTGSDGFCGKYFGLIQRYLEGRTPPESLLAPLIKHPGEIPEASASRSYQIGEAGRLDAYIGIDVGSLSTNVVAVDSNGKVIAWRYLKTAGRPLEAVKQGMKEIGDEAGSFIRVVGIGTTGSGRYLTGDFVGADVVKNEITAQARAAIHYDKNVDTIFEIGGQDSKYVSIDGGVVVDFEMNKACAAGTGSFLEEQAEKLGLNIIDEFGNLAFEAKCPGCFGDRCTVFMETDLVCHQQQGISRDNLVAGLAYSIVLNYLNKVVGDRRIGDRIFFQGGVASNKAVVRAFEKVLDKKIIVPPYHDVTGAIGAAILAKEAVGREGGRNFKGFDLSNRTYKSEPFTCQGCANFCEVRKITFGEERPLYYGARCERYEINDEKKERAKSIPDLFSIRDRLLFAQYEEDKKKSVSQDAKRKRIGIPRVLQFYELFPFWYTFFKNLDFEVVLSPVTNPALIHESVENITADTCFPIKIIHGHILELARSRVDYIFFPAIINMKRSNPKMELNYNCPLVQAAPYIARGAAGHEAARSIRWITTPIFFQRGSRHIESVLNSIGKELGCGKADIRAAYRKAEEAQESFYRALKDAGREAISLIGKDKKAAVIMSRPYNGCDPAMNLGVPKKLRDLGVMAIPFDFLPLDEVDISDEHPNMFWRYGQRLIAGARFIKEHPELNAIYISNFKCGPDSFILHYVRKTFDKFPYLQLEIDEHSADAGVVTRLEAFFDSLENAKGKKEGVSKDKRALISKHTFKGRVIYVPYMSDHAFPISAGIRHFGMRTEILPESDDRTIEIGRRYSSGKECFPFAVTTGDILKKCWEKDFDPKRSAFFIPDANGPCRFGQYNRMHRIILDELGFKDVALFSPNSKTSYSEFGENAIAVRRMAWWAMVATDILQKLRAETRPYELVQGETNRVYADCLNRLTREFEQGAKALDPVMRSIKEEFARIPRDRSRRKPLIGVVGEIFVRVNRFSNDSILERIEALGGEAWLASFSEWIFYLNHRVMEDGLWDRNLPHFLEGFIKDWVQRYDEHRLLRPFRSMWYESLDEPPIKKVIDNAAPFLTPAFGGEAILSIGKAIEFIRHGASGIVNVMPFTCLPGMVVSAISKRIREELDNVPWLNITFDGQHETGTLTRLEAFLYQAKQYQERKSGAQMIADGRLES
ncbi:MAG: acyl-CoA dehydratase activase [Candidatus Omnitrophica bacterium]|nr:acyl-CoA dehydratase activase [Candidatus Omnitrophota bacterium]